MQFSDEFIDCELRPSRTQFALIVMTHVLAAMSLPLTGYGAGLGFALLLAIIVSGFYFVRPHLVDEALDIRGLGYHRGYWQLHTLDRTRLDVTLTGDQVVLPFLIVLTFQGPYRHRYCVPILRDSTSADDFRHLKVFLNFYPNRGGMM